MCFTSVIIVTLAILLLVTIWWYYIYFKYKKFLKTFPSRSYIPLLGITYHIRNSVDLYDTILSMAKKIGSKNYFTMMGAFPVLFTSDPKVVSLILGSPKHINKSWLYKAMENSFEDTLLLTNDDKWRQQRKLLNPVFSHKNIKENINIFNAQSDSLVELLGEEVDKQSTEISHLLESWGIQQSFDTMIGDNAPLEDKIEILNAIRSIAKIITERFLKINEFFNFTSAFTKNFWLERKALKFVFKRIRDTIKTKDKEIIEGTIQKDQSILIDILMNEKKIDKNITNDFIVKQIGLMIASSFDTTATTITFALYNLSIFPEIQKRAYDELFSILGDDINQFITNEQINEMTYLDLVIKESMRMKTPVPFFSRQLDEDVSFEGSILPKGLTVALLAYAMHLDPEIYPEPEEFIPERFTTENLNNNKYSYIPFAGGIRNCIGQKYAMLAMKVALAKILLNYEVVDVNHQLSLACEIVLKSKTGVKVGIRRRSTVNKEL